MKKYTYLLHVSFAYDDVETSFLIKSDLKICDFTTDTCKLITEKAMKSKSNYFNGVFPNKRRYLECDKEYFENFELDQFHIFEDEDKYGNIRTSVQFSIVLNGDTVFFYVSSDSIEI
jgi:hypothetical protein